jgi:predicted ester cyclase
MTTAENAALMRRYWPEANEHGLLSIVDRYVAPDVVSHPPASASPEPLVGRDAYKRFVEAQFYGNFPNLKTTIEDLIADGEFVGLRVTASSSRVRFSGMELFRLRDGRIIEQWGEFDGVAVAQQLGLMPTWEMPRLLAAVNGHATDARDVQSTMALGGQYVQAFPDAHNEVDTVLSDGAAVLTRGVFTGTHRGDFMGMPATGKRVRMTWMVYDRMSGGRIAERWVEQDAVGLLQQLAPAPQAAFGTTDSIRARR